MHEMLTGFCAELSKAGWGTVTRPGSCPWWGRPLTAADEKCIRLLKKECPESQKSRREQCLRIQGKMRKITGTTV